MSDSPHGAALSLVIHEGSDPGEVDESLNELQQQVAASEEHIAKLQRELKEAADQEAETARQLDTEQTQKAAFAQQLHEARTEAAGLMLDEATRTRNAMVAEAEELLEASRIEAEREASKITKQTFGQAKEMLADAKREGAAIVDAGRDKLSALEADAADRVAALDAEHRELTQRLRVMETLYTELQETLQLVAETSVKELAETQASLKQLDPVETQPPPPEPTGEQTTPGSAPQDDSTADLEAPSDSEGVEPASMKIPPLSDPGRITATT
jgi:vacuolar-type H+-ATPase subunit H